MTKKKKKWYKNTTKKRMGNIIVSGLFAIGLTLFILYYPPEKQKPKIEKQIQVNKDLQKIVSIIKNRQPRIDPAIIKPTAEAILKYSKEYNFPWMLILAIVSRESTFNPIAISNKNCVGLMQINEKFHTEKLEKLGINSNQLFHIDPNIALGCMILDEYYQQTHSIEKALTKYVGGSQQSYICDILSDYTDLTISK